MKGNHRVMSGQYVRFKEINIKRNSEVSESLVNEDIERIIRRLKRAGYDFDIYEIHVQTKDVGIEPEKKEDLTLFEIFVNHPADIKSELHLNQIISYMTETDTPFEGYIGNFIAAIIAINYNNNEDEFEMEYGLDNLTDIRYLSQQDICNIINSEFEWMGLGWEARPWATSKRKIYFEYR